MRVFRPLPHDHPVITDHTLCPVCHKQFNSGERTVLTAVRDPGPVAETVQALLLHATCALRGHHSPVGFITRIKDGDGSPYPVETTDNRQYTLAEAGLE
jgi:hypothetical protein